MKDIGINEYLWWFLFEQLFIITIKTKNLRDKDGYFHHEILSQWVYYRDLLTQDNRELVKFESQTLSSMGSVS